MGVNPVDLVLGKGEEHLAKAGRLLQYALEQSRSVQSLHGKTSPRYCEAEVRLERAQAIHRAVTDIVMHRTAKSSDMAILRSWLAASLA